ncbi:MAG: GerMN domain-containing protein [Janthinobacterium lividum]
MIPRYQRILFVALLVSSVFMAGFLVYLHQKNFSEVKNADNTPIEAPVYSAADQVTLLLASDADGNLKVENRLIALPQSPAVRGRALLEHLLAEYSLPHAAHKLGGGVAVDDVYLVPLPLGGQTAADAGIFTTPTAAVTKQDEADPLTHATGQLAIVNLRSAWVDAHPSGITTETLTIQSMVGTLHANLGEITAVRFLVDGKQRATLAGNVELDRTYDAADASR